MTSVPDRLPSALRRLRWPVVAAWVLAVVVLTPVASGLPRVTNDAASAYLALSAQSTRVAALSAARHTARQPGSQQAIVVLAREGGLTGPALADPR